jgi:hypothetical protein
MVVTDIWTTAETVVFPAVFFWKRVKLGWREFAPA